MDRIRLMIADDEAEFRTLLEAYFSSRPEFDVVGLAKDGQEALSGALQLKPDVLLCDINMPAMDGLAVTQKLTESLPECLVIILSGNDYDTFSKKAILAGAKEYVNKPVDLDAIGTKVTDVVKKAKEVRSKATQRKQELEKAAKIFAFYSPKGSAGSTSLAVNAALELTRCNQKVLLIDLNLQFGDIEFLLDLKQRVNLSSLIGENGELISYKIVGAAENHKGNANLRVLYQNKLEESELVTPAHIAALLKHVRSAADTDFVLLDLARQLDERTLSAIDAADTLFLVVTEDYLSIKNAKLCMELFKKLGYTETKVKILVNKVAGGLTGHVAQHLAPPFSTFPLQTKLFEQSVKSGFPPIIEHPSNPFSQSVSNLVASAMLLKKEPGAVQTADEGGIGKLFRKLFS